VTRLLSWRAAERGDRPALQAFTCTVPARRNPDGRYRHPKPWELEVQSFIRALRPPLSPNQSLLLGEDANGIAAICLLAQQKDPSFIKIQVLAIATRYRGLGGTYGNEALDVALETALERGRKSRLDEVIVVGWVNQRNYPAKLLNQRTGFICQGKTQDGFEIWARILDTEEGPPGSS
jgi:hypothetical protein